MISRHNEAAALVSRSAQRTYAYVHSTQVKGAAHSTFERAKEVNEEHGVVDKAKAGVSRAWQRLREVREWPRLCCQ